MEEYSCEECNYMTNRKGKLKRHLQSLKHQIRVYGITCCQLTYFEKHQYINHKRSEKHRMARKLMEPPQLGNGEKLKFYIDERVPPLSPAKPKVKKSMLQLENKTILI